MRITKIHIVVVVVVVACISALTIALAFLVGFELPPKVSNLPSDAYDEARVRPKEIQLSKIAADYMAEYRINVGEAAAQQRNERYERLIDGIIDPSTTPEELAMLAIWAHHRNPEIGGKNAVENGVYFGNIYRLGKIKGDRAAYALWKIRIATFLSGYLDAHYAEEIVEAQEAQRLVK